MSIAAVPETPIKGRGGYADCRRKCQRRVLDQAFANLLDRLHFDEKILDWVKAALRASHADARFEHEQVILRSQVEYKRLEDRLHAMYLDKLDGRIDNAFYHPGVSFWQRPFVPAESLISLREMIGDLSRPLPAWNRQDQPDSKIEAEILKRGSDADLLPERLEELDELIRDARRFFWNENTRLIERWSKNNSSPFKSFLLRLDRDELIIRSITFEGFHYVKLAVPADMFSSLEDLPSKLLTLRRPAAQER